MLNTCEIVLAKTFPSQQPDDKLTKTASVQKRLSRCDSQIHISTSPMNYRKCTRTSDLFPSFCSYAPFRTSLFVDAKKIHLHLLPFLLTFIFGYSGIHIVDAVVNSTSLSPSLQTSRPLGLVGSFVFDPRVSAKCERNLMQISVQLERPFSGIVHVRNFRRDPCQAFGNGSTSISLTIDLLAQSNRPNYCGIHRVKGTEERSISLVVRLHRALELSDDKHFIVTCGNTEFFNRNKNEKLMFKFVDATGHKISKLYHGEPYRLRAEIVSSSQELQEASIGPSAKVSSYHLFVKNCFIFNDNQSDVEFLDANGCSKLNSISPFKQIGHNIAEAEITSMFKLPDTNQLHLQCMVELIENCHFCDATLCTMLANDTRKSKQIFLQPVDMQMLASTTAYVIEPDQMMSASMQANSNCSEWRFPWLIALCIMLGILLIIMMVVNLFLCTSMSCSCCKPEIIDQEPTIIEEYDPYKVDMGYFSPYDSRLSLNRNYLPVAGSYVSAGNDSGEHFFGLNAPSRQSPPSNLTRDVLNQHSTHGTMLFNSHSPISENQASHHPRITVAAVRNVNSSQAPSRSFPNATNNHFQAATSSISARQKQPSSHHTHQLPLDRYSPRSIRSQEFY